MNHRIEFLDNKTRNIIAAGEIIVDIYSVIKELVENSIDAKSTKITINVQGGGLKMISVEDNGIGMDAENLLKCKQQYATSKFTSLDNISELGFRGEALFAISQVSKVNIFSNQKMINNDNKITPHATNQGTKIIVTDIFYNYPVRLKFVKKSQSHKINQLIEKYVLAYRDITFILKKSHRTITFNANNLLDSIFNKSFCTSRIDVSGSNESYEISGSIFQGIKQKYFLYVNGRPLEDRKLLSSMRQSYESISGYTNVAFILFIKCHPNKYDIHIHPNKQEIRFIDDSIFTLLQREVKRACTYWKTMYLEELSTKTKPNWSLREKSNHETKWSKDSLIFTYKVANKYLVFLFYDEIVIMDQHAAHERILTEEYKNLPVEITNLLEPINITISNKNMLLIQNHMSIFSKYIQFVMHDTTICITGVASLFNSNEIYNLFVNMKTLDDIEMLWHEKLHELGCRNALRINENLDNASSLALLHQISNIKCGSFCNHGRPTYHIFNLSCLNKLFLRT